MLLLAHLLAVVVAVMVFLWMIVLHRRARAMAELPPRKIAVPTFESAFASRPPLWMAVRATDSGPVQAALGLNQPTPCSWTEGMTGERKYFIGPPVNGWIIVTGSGLLGGRKPWTLKRAEEPLQATIDHQFQVAQG